MHCTNCGTQVHDQAIACPQCGVPPRSQKKYCNSCGAPTVAEQIMCTKCGVALVKQTEPRKKNWAAFIAFFAGGIGAHKFYLGSWGWGLVYLVLCWTYIPAVVALVEFIMYLVMDQAKFDAKYNATPRAPFKW